MFARKQGVHILELVGFDDNVRHQASETNPYIRMLSHSPFFSFPFAGRKSVMVFLLFRAKKGVTEKLKINREG